MSRWDISNNVEYKGVNVARRDLIETINYDNIMPAIFSTMQNFYMIREM